jgi:hypothetical protein
MIRTRHAATVAAVCMLAACGSSSPSISSGAAGTLHQDVLALTTAVANHRWNVADHALTQLRADLTTAAAGGAVSSLRMAAIQADIASVQADLAVRRESHPPLTSSTPPPTPAPKPKPKPTPPGHEHGHGHGHGGEGGD